VVSGASRRVHVGNTDADERMVMVDVFCEMREKAVGEVSPQLFTIATLTGHAMGPNYSIIMDNGAAHLSGNAHQWQKAGRFCVRIQAASHPAVIGSPIEWRTIGPASSGFGLKCK
jgi:hypothetical protein